MKPKRTAKIDLSNLPKVTNAVFYPLYKNSDRYLVLYGGAGSGKSKFTAQKLIFRMLTEKGHKFLCLRKVAKTLRNSVYAELTGMIRRWGMEPLFTFNESRLEITCNINGNQIITSGLDDVEKLKSVEGITGMWIEEASELEPEDFQQLDLRLRGHTRHYKQIIITFNPISDQHWLKKHFFDFKRQGCTVVHSTYKDNRFIDTDYIRMLEELREIDPHYYEIYALGKWGQLGDVVLSNWVVEKVPTGFDYENNYVGMDFGFNDPSVILCIGIKDDEVYIWDEFYQSKLTNTELINQAKNMGIPEWVEMIGDSAEPDRIEEFRRAGFRCVGAEKGKHSVKHGVDFLKRRKIHIHPQCVNTIKEIQGWVYKKDKDGNVTDEPIGFNDHAMAALRYGTEPMRKHVKPFHLKALF